MRSLQAQDVNPVISSENKVAEENKVQNEGSVVEVPNIKRKSFGQSILDSKIFRWIVVLCIALCVSYISIALLAALLVWFLPTIVSVFADLEDHKSLTKNIMCFNCLGAAPSICFILKYGDISSNALSVFMSASALFYIYAVVAVGIVIYFVIPRYIMASENLKLVQRINETEKELDTLTEEWNFKRN